MVLYLLKYKYKVDNLFQVSCLDLVRAIDLGVEGYILKDSGSMEVKKAIHAVLKGESYIQPNLIPALNHYLIHKDDDKEKLKSLTKREIEVLIEVAKGNFNRDIAFKNTSYPLFFSNLDT